MKHYKKTMTMLLTAAVLLVSVFMTGCTSPTEPKNNTPSGTDAPAESDGLGVYVKLENVTDKQGFHATMYLKFNPEKGRPYRYDTNPDNAQQVAPSNESRTQVAVNNEGKTNEATKEQKEPLQKGQTAPKNENQQRQQDKPKKNNKGMKM